VFAAGVFTLAGAAGRDAVLTQLLANLWDKPSQP
jgi:hypothetical protein